MAKVTAKQIASRAGLNFEHVLYRRTGDWYHILEKFPAALLDENGYIPFQTEVDYKSFVNDSVNDKVRENRDTKTLIVKDGISRFSEYLSFTERFVFPEQVAHTEFFEGAAIRVIANRYERDARARKLCIAKWGLACMACDLSFASTYGPLGDGFIHVHHLTPIASIREEYVLVPERDLRPVCPNCHAMLHRQEPPLSIQALRAVLGKST